MSNLAGGTFDLVFDAQTGSLGGSRTMGNAGRFRKVGGSGTAYFGDRFHNNGTLEVLSGTLTLNGGYNPSPIAALNFGLKGTADFGKVSVSGQVYLAGRVGATLLNGYVPVTNSTFQVMTFGSRSGDFSDYGGLYVGNGLYLQPVFSPTSLTLITTSNYPPSVVITTPADGAGFNVPTNILIRASAQDTNGTITKMELFADGAKLGESASNPFSLTWTNVPGGSHSLSARATDDQGAIASSLPVSIVLTSSCVAPSGDLVGWWPGDGHVNDLVGTNHGRLVNGATAGAAGEVGGAFSFDGTDDYVQVGDSSGLVLSNALTIEAWIYPTGPGQSGAGGIIVSKEGEYELQRFTDGSIRWALANQSPGWTWVNTGVIAPAGAWSHVAFTYASGVAATYLNGSLRHSYPATGPIGDSSPSLNDLRIGGRQAASEYFQGWIDEVSVCSRALSPEEIAAIYTAGSAGKCRAGTPPSVVIQPTNVAVYPTTTASFSVSAAGSRPLGYQWRFRNVDLANATNATLLLSNVQPSQAGAYSVVVSNLYGLVTSTDAVLTVRSDIADLVVTGLSAPGSGLGGQAVPLVFTIINQGSATAQSPWNNAVFLASDSSGGGAQILGTLGFYNPLPAGASVTLTQAVILPTSVVGPRYLGLIADSDSQVFETNKANNTAVAALPIQINAPDLVVDALAVPPNALFGQTISVNWAVRNTGSSAATANWNDRLYLGTTSNSLAGATVLLTQPALATLGAGAGYTNTRALTLPLSSQIMPGNYFILVATDFSNAQSESDEANNLASAPLALTFPPLPDLTVTNIVGPAMGQPGQRVSVSWAVTNQGAAPATGVWSESVYLSAGATLGRDTLLATFTFTNNLAPGTMVVRTQTVTIPLIGIAGDLRFVVATDSGSDLTESIETNNTAFAAQAIQVPASLALYLPVTSIAENANPPNLQALVLRNGNLSAPLVVSLVSSDTHELTAPASVTIFAGQDSAAFNLTVRRDQAVDPDRPITVRATASGYDSASAVVTVLNSDLPRLSLQIQTPLVTEGDTVAATVSRDTVTDQPLVVSLASSSAANLAPPESVTIPAYSNSCTFLLLAVDDALITPTRTYTVTAAAAGYAGAAADVAVADNDLPTLTLTLASTNISEGAGAQATTATVRRQMASSRSLIVALQSTDPTAAAVPPTVTIPAGQYEAVFPIGAVNDDLLNGPRMTDIIAYATDSLQGNVIGTPASQGLIVTDDDGPTLAVTLARKLVAEGQNPATAATVRRNTPATNHLVVSLISSDTTEATVPSTVTIPTGQAAATFDIASLDDAVTDGNQSVRINASAAGFTSGSDTLVVSDINLADLVIASITAPTNGVTEQSFNVTYRLVNQGLAASTNRFKQRVLLSSDAYLGDDTLLGQYDFNGSIPAGQYFEQTVQLRLPRPPGNYWVVVAADVENSVAECQEENNALISTRPIQVVAEYAATVQTDVTTLRQGEAVPFYGTATLAGGGPAAYKLVNLHLEVRGIQRVIAALTDANGNFSITFNPLPGEAGHYTVGAAHPGQSAAPVQDEFTILGMKLNPATVTLSVVEDGSVAGSVKVQNLSELPLQGLTATVSNAAGNLLVAATVSGNGILPGLGELELGYAVTANDAVIRQSSFLIHVTSAEGLTLDLPVSVNVEPLRARLAASPGELVAGMARGGQAVVTFRVANIGGVPTGPVAVVIPEASWLHVASTNPLPSLAPGETNQVILLLTPAADLALGPYAGSLALNGSGVTLSVPFSFRALSEAKGDLRVTAVDEYTYYAEGSPRVTNAMVTVSDAVTKQVLTNGVTDADGIYLLRQIQEGYYEIEVSATKHLTYRGTTLVVAGQTNDVPAFLPRQTVQYIWTVVPTEIEDRTIITLETEFETDVPVPVVTVEPTTIDLIDLTQPGQVLAIDLKISNHGLIAAQGLKLAYEPHPWYDISPLIEDIGVLPAKSSLTVPLTITRRGGSLAPEKKVAKASAAGGGGVPCDARIWVDWYYPCGEVSVGNRVYIPTLHAAGGCVLPVTPMNFPSVGSVQWGPTGGSAYGGEPQGSLVTPNVVTTPSCDPCLVKAGLECAIGFTGPVGCAYGVMSCVGGLLSSGFNAASAENCVANVGGCWLPPPVSCAWSFLRCRCDGPIGSVPACVAGAFSGGGGPSPACLTALDSRAKGAGGRTLSPFDPLDVYAARAYTVMHFYQVLLGDADGEWFYPDPYQSSRGWMTAFIQAMQSNSPDGVYISEGERAQLLGLPRTPQVSESMADQTIARWNRSVTYWRNGIYNRPDLPMGYDTNFITAAELTAAASQAATSFEQSMAAGYEDPLAGFYAALAAKQRGDSGGVCARVKLRINQEAVIAREAFNATLELINSSPTLLEGIAVDVVVRNEAGQDVTEWFGLRPPVLDGLSGVDGAGVVNANASGSASWIIIPTSDAAPETATRYLVGGTLRYTQEGISVTVPLTPAPITVHPNPRLAVKYFHQRDVFSDDPFTEEIEPAIPFSLAVMIQNQGMGVARNVRITSAQPQIIENEKGLLIDFNIIATEVAGQNLTPSLTANFGAIDPGQIAIGRWLLTASLQGLFIDYQASFEHIDGLGNKKLSLIESVKIHEMIHLVRAGGAFEDGNPDFLVNDVVDVDDRPDTLYLSDGTVQPVSVATEATADGPPTSGDLEVLLTVNMPAGWTYLRVPDPGNGQFRLVGVRRSDGTSLLADNFWTTDRTFLGNAKRPIRENILHLLDYNGTGSYALIYAPPVPPDTTPPASVVAQLPANCAALIPLSWTGSDNAEGSGIAFYDIYVSVNGGPFMPWLQQTPQNGAIYPGTQDNTYAFYSVATDRAGNREAPPATPDTQTTATLVNTTPLLAPLPVQTVNEGEEVSFSAAATDAEAPPQTLSYSLAHAPAGMTIHPVTGLVRWPTGEANGPSTNLITIAVRDNGAPALGATQTVTVVVNEVNTVPALREIADHVLTVGETLLVTNRATDLDLPAQTLTFHLEAAPPGLTLHPVSGLLRWTPSAVFASTTNVITVRVTDNGPPNLSATQSFRVIVLDYLSLGLGSTVLRVGDNGDVPINVFSSAGVVDLSFAVDVPSNRLANLDIGSLGPQIGSASIQVMGTRSVINISTSGGQPLLGAEPIASFQFTAVSNASAFVPLLVGEVVGTKSDGTRIPRAETRPGRVVVIGDQPLLEAILLTNQQVLLVLYGIPGTTYRIEGAPSVSEPTFWTPLQAVTLTSFIEVLEPMAPTPPTRFFRARQE